MKRTFIISAVCIMFLCSAALIPGTTKQKDILGKWKLHLDISEKIKEETKDEDDLGALFARGIGTLVDELVEEVDITFDFQKNNILVVTQDSNFKGDKKEIETYHWKIDKKGRIITTSMDEDQISFNDHEGWMLKNGKLVSVDKNEEIETVVWLERME